MPCNKCGQSLILLYDEQICPRCNQLKLLDLNTSINVANKLVELASKIFNTELKKWQRDTLLGNLAAKRELLSREYFKEYSLLSIGKLADLTLLMKRVTTYGSFNGKTPERTNELDELIISFEALNQFESNSLKIRAGYANILQLGRYHRNTLTLNEATRIFHVCHNEAYLNFERTLESHDIFTEEMAKKKFEEHEQMEEHLTDQIQHQLLTPQEFIKKNYEILNQIFVFFHRNKAYAECFDIGYLEKLLNEPRDLIEFISSSFILYTDKVLTACPTGQFIKRASNYFGKSKTEIKNLLVFDVNNSSIFPLFVRFRNKDLRGDVICITQDFSRFIYTILHVTMNKDLFDQETLRLSKDFENKKVRAKFEENGYIYKPNISDRKNATLQIDGLAIKENKCYIVECKGWRLPKLVDEPETKEHIIRDLKGIVLGKKYTIRNGILIEKEKPSLIKKIEFVKTNIVELGLKYGFDSSITDFEGLIVTIDYPPIPSYNKIRITSIHQIPELQQI